MSNIIIQERAENKIYLLREQKVMLDYDLAKLYGVATRVLIQAVTRNIDRFPQDFMFRLTKDEYNCLRSQIVILDSSSIKQGRGKYAKYLPYAFTEQGVAMLSGVIRSKRAVQVNIAIMRAFVKIKQMLASHKDLAVKIDQLERKHSKHDVEIQTIFNVIKKLIMPPEKPKRPIGFLRDREE